MKQLLSKHRTPVLKGFTSSKTKRKFDAALVLKEDFTLAFEFVNAGAKADKIDEFTCPKCKGEMRFLDGEYPRYVCAGGDFKLWAIVAGRKLSTLEAAELVRDGELSSRSGFVSAAKKPFAAGMRLSDDLSKVDLVFEDR